VSGGERRWAARRGRGVGRDGPRTRWRVFGDDADSGKRRRRPALQGVETYLILERASAPRARRVPRVSTHGRSLDAARPLSWWPRARRTPRTPARRNSDVIRVDRHCYTRPSAHSGSTTRDFHVSGGEAFLGRSEADASASTELDVGHDPPPPRPLAFVMWVAPRVTTLHPDSPVDNGSSRPPCRARITAPGRETPE